MNTNNRNVRLQQHVVLLTVMEPAEDLIKRQLLTIQIITIGISNSNYYDIHFALYFLNFLKPF